MQNSIQNQDPLTSTLPPADARGVELIAAALAKAQAKFVQPEKNKTVTVKPRDSAPYSFDYADYSAIVEAVRGPLSENGICFTHFLSEGARGGLLLVTQLIHSSGQILECTWPIRNSNEPKSIGGDMTYGKRYCLSALTGCVADDDVDVDPVNTQEFKSRNASDARSKASPKPQQTSKTDQSSVSNQSPAPKASPEPSAPPAPEDPNLVTQAQIARLFTIAKSAHWSNDQVKLYLMDRWKYESTKQLTREQYDMLVNVISTRGYFQAHEDIRSMNESKKEAAQGDFENFKG